MCGINGIISSDPNLNLKISSLNKLLRHRGPDDEGFVFINSGDNNFVQASGDDTIPELKSRYKHINDTDTKDYDVVLAQRRLSIIDLSANGHGPMSDESGKIWITFNGEIYNYIELREELQKLGYKFRTQTDTEVIINSYLQWGKGCLNKFNGMWAFALWDSNNNELFLARDRFGVKPLHYSFTKNYFAFSSEIKPLMYLDEANAKLNEKRIPFFILYGNRLNNNETYLENIFSLRPSHYLAYKDGKIVTKQYYEIPLNVTSKTDSELSEEIVSLLTDSIKLRFRSDVPVGTCLSGGFDSSSIVALSNRFLPKGLSTFSAVWKEKECDESRYIDLVNEKFNCKEHKIFPDAHEFEKVFKELNYYQEIPTEGPGLYPQWYVMKKAKGNVKVLLDGQGGDEVFGGYFHLATYLRSLLIEKKFTKAVKDVRLYKQFLNQTGIHSFTGWLFPKAYNKIVRGFLSDKNKIINEELTQSIRKELFHFDAEPPKIYGNYLNNLSFHFIRNLTVPTLLHYEDRSSMAHSIESRVPFLDYRLAELGVNLRPEHLLDKETSRPLFRNALKPYLPEEITNRKDKLGYPTPFKSWTRTKLKDYINGILTDKNKSLYSYINFNYVQKRLKDHYAEKDDFSWDIWRLLSFNEFLELPNLVSNNTAL